jgi:hypothetical protein
VSVGLKQASILSNLLHSMSESSRATVLLKESGTRRMRKGTHSCSQCNLDLLRDRLGGSLSSAGRLRKIKCIYRPNNPAVCINCFSRGVHCGSQEAAQIIIQSQDSRLNLKERVARLEHLIGSMLSGQVRPEDVSRPNLQLPRESQSTSYSTPIELTRPGGELQDVPENIPAFSLFENDILAHDETGSLPQYIRKEFNSQFLIPKGDDDTLHSRTSQRKRTKLCQALTSLLPTGACLLQNRG